ncbi:type II secretion system minor pseudopilin GspH [Kordiimonas sp. SCSIO 12610]|uniref:type II secretion system minor pseudopilin GspH n=1 Tax=Kordiimonas sp. SCSIO 12610 TaxID=2829597 RepID=UPI00210DAD62|nr:type II secretion system minor pseudopilin GspH [Kordiimonas sp. SCSIO 12610]UTW56526.1 type II secretion system minor pseudopilin GspH [Kordiimonas sp. SCSIO 12610]
MWVTGKHNSQQIIVSPRTGHSTDAGFTLIELLVVIVIIGLMASVVVLNLPSNRQTLSDETDVIVARLNLASQEAILTGSVIGLKLDRDGYSFMRRQRGEWLPYAASGKQGTILWPENIKLAFEFEGEKVAIGRSSTKATPLIPNVFFLPSGETQNFSLTLSGAGEEETIQVLASGQITLQSAEAF